MSIVVDVERVPEMSSAQEGNLSESLKIAAEHGNIQTLYELIAEHPGLLDQYDKVGFCQTPLHIAAEKGNSHFAMELMTLKPALALKLNPSGFSPLHLALQNNHTRTVRGFISMENSLVRIKGRGRFTPLHYVAKCGDAELLSEFLVACPSSVDDLTIKLESVVHVALKNYQIDVFKVLLGWLKRVNRDDILDWKDEDGNTVFHVAASINQTQVMKLLGNIVKVKAKNLDGKTAIDVLQTHRSPSFPKTRRLLRSTKERLLCGSTLTLAEYLKRKRSCIEKCNNLLGLSYLNRTRHESINSSDSRSLILVVAILIVTATYQAGLSPPGGFWQDTNDGHRAGEMIMHIKTAIYFYVLNEIAFFSSLYVILIFIIGLPMWKVLFGSIVALGIGNFATFLNTFPLSQITEDDEFAAFFFIFIAYPVTLASIIIAPFVAFLINKRRRNRVDFPARYFTSPHELS